LDSSFIFHFTFFPQPSFAFLSLHIFSLYSSIMSRAPPPPPKPTPKASSAAATSDDPNWIEKFTADQVAYYYNTATESVSWDKPNSLKSADEKERDQGDWVWVSDPKEAWVPAMVKSKSGNNATVVR
jgi:hypothetical protein